MTSHRPRRIAPPGGTRKRKEREGPSFPAAKPTSAAYSANAREPGEAKAMSSNRLLAGYMAYEFLTRGTLFGQKLESAQRRMIRKDDEESSQAEMARIVKSDGTHIPGVVNPSELSRWMQT